MKIAGIVLSAGRSTRMGRPKFAVTLRGATLLVRCLDSLATASTAPLVVVARAGDQDAIATASVPHRPALTINPDPDRGMLSSVHAGLSAAGVGRPGEAGATWAFVLPIDCPGVTPSTCALLSAAVRGTEAAAAVPEHRGRRGHPVLLGSEVARSIQATVEAEDGGTLAQVLAEFGDRVRVVPVDDEAVTDNVNRPGDVERLRERLQEEDDR